MLFELHRRLSVIDDIPSELLYGEHLDRIIVRLQDWRADAALLDDGVRIWERQRGAVLDIARDLSATLTRLMEAHGLKPHLVHGDPVAANMIFDGTIIKGIIDFDQVIGFVAEYDLVRCMKSMFRRRLPDGNWGRIEPMPAAAMISAYADAAAEAGSQQRTIIAELIPACIAFTNLDSIYFLIECSLLAQDKTDRLRRYIEQLLWISNCRAQTRLTAAIDAVLRRDHPIGMVHLGNRAPARSTNCVRPLNCLDCYERQNSGGVSG